MINILYKDVKNKKVKKLRKLKKGCWVRVINPSSDEIKTLKQLLGMSKIEILQMLDENEKPRIEKEKDKTIVVFRVPQKIKSKIKTIPLTIILKRGNIITISIEKLNVLDEFEKGKIKDFLTTKRNRFLLQILAITIKYYINYLDEIEEHIENIEKKVMKSFKNEEMIGLLRFRKILAYFNTAIIANENVLERILNGNVIKLYEEDEDVLEDIIIENKQAIDMVKIFTDILNNTMEMYTGIISNNLNSIMKFLTSITIILSFPTIIASIYGMNVYLPLQHTEYAFYFIILITILISTIIYVFFSKKGWI